MTPTAEQLIETVRALPGSEKKKFFEMIEAEKTREIDKAKNFRDRNEKFRPALQWIAEHKEEYDGLFVLLDGDQLIAHGKDPKPLYSKARAEGIEIPFVKIIKAKELPFGGW